jgi:hypothetical protein
MQTIDFVAQEDKGDLLTGRIGNPSDIGKLHPELTLQRWGEASLTFRMEGFSPMASIVEQGTDWATWRAADTEIKLYPHGKDGYEWEIVLLSRPMSNKFTFQITLENLIAAYQPPLTALPKQMNWNTVTDTEAFDKAGKRVAYRPPEVVGSYALYHKFQAGDYSKQRRRPGNNYRAGKFGHLFRPKAIDQGGHEAWCELSINSAGKQATIAIPQTFLDSAIYPVIIDPEFGYHVIGGSSSSWGTAMIGFGPETPLTSGSADAVYLYMATGMGNNVNLTVGIHANAAGVPGALLGDSAGIPLIDSAGAWFGGPLDALVPIIGGVPYWLSKDHSPAIGLDHWWDNAPGYTVAYKFRAYIAGVLDNPFGALDGSFAATRGSIYANYVEGGGGGVPEPVLSPVLGRKIRIYR